MTQRICLFLVTICLSACQAANYLTSTDCDADKDDDFAAGECGGHDCNDQSGRQSSLLAEVCGDKLDNNCNGVIDEGCDCAKEHAQRPCFVDPDAQPFVVSLPENQTTCRAGVQQCLNGSWGACLQAKGPTDEVCDGKDNDCDGEIDEGFDTGMLCNMGVGSCKKEFRTACTSLSTVSVCEPDVPSDDFLTLSPRNGSWDNNCDGTIEKQCCIGGSCSPCPPVGGCSCAVQGQIFASAGVPGCGNDVLLTHCPTCNCYDENPRHRIVCTVNGSAGYHTNRVGCR